MINRRAHAVSSILPFFFFLNQSRDEKHTSSNTHRAGQLCWTSAGETSLWIFTMATKPAEKSPTKTWKNVYAPFYTIHQTWVFVFSLPTFRFLGCSSSSLSYTDPVFWSVMPLVLLKLLFPNCMHLYYFTKWPLKISPTLIVYTFMEHSQNNYSFNRCRAATTNR